MRSLSIALAVLLSYHVSDAFAPVVGPLARAPTVAVGSNRPPSSPTGPLSAVSKKDTYSITLLPGDGIGPEITAATKRVLAELCARCGFGMELTEAAIGGAAIDATNDPFPNESLEQCRASDSVLLACIGGYKWDNNPRELRPETGLLKMRKELGLFANLRPAKVLKQLVDASTLKREIVEGVDVMVVRELTGDVYFGTPKGIDQVDGECVRMCVRAYGRTPSMALGGDPSLMHNSLNSFLCRRTCWLQQYDLPRVRD